MRETILTSQLPPTDYGFPWKNIKPWQTGLVTGLAVLVGIFSLFSANYTGKEWLFYVLGLLLLGIFTLSLVKPRTSFYLAIIFIGIEHIQCYPMVYKKWVPFCITLNTVFLFMAIPGWLLQKWSKIIPSRKFIPLDLPLLLLVIIGGISLLWSLNPLFGVFWWFMLACNFALYYLTGALVTDEKILRRVITSLIIGTLIIGVGCIYTGLNSIYYEDLYRLGRWNFSLIFKGAHRAGGFAGTNHAAFTLNMTLSFVLANLFRAKKIGWKILHGAIAFYILFSEVLTQSRTGTVCTLVIIVLSLCFLVEWKNKLIRNIIIAFLVIILIMIFANIVQSGKSFFGRYSAVVTSDSGKITGIGIRIQWWIEGIVYMMKHNNFLWGLGMGGLMWAIDIGPDINSVYFCFPFELGLIGVGLFMYIIIVFIHSLYPVFRYALKHRSYASDMFLASLTSFIGTVMIHGLVEYDFYGRIVWLNIAMVMTTWHFTKEKMDSHKQELTTVANTIF